MTKPSLALLLGVTGNLAFAAGTLLQAVKRHSPQLLYDIFIYHDGTIPPADAALLRNMGARLVPFRLSLPDGIKEDFLTTFSALTFVRFESLNLLQRYKHVLYLDIDIAVQGDISPLLDYGPFGVTLQDKTFVTQAVSSKAGDNVSAPIPGLIEDAPNINAGVLFVNDELPDPKGLYVSYQKWLVMYGNRLLFCDQALLNLMAHRLAAADKILVKYIPTEKFNTHPYSFNAQMAVLLHAFGENKFWSDDLMGMLCPEWRRDYAAWLEKGGTGWTGPVRNAEIAQDGAYSMIWRFLTREKEYEAQIEDLQRRLQESGSALPEK